MIRLVSCCKHQLCIAVSSFWRFLALFQVILACVYHSTTNLCKLLQLDRKKRMKSKWINFPKFCTFTIGSNVLSSFFVTEWSEWSMCFFELNMFNLALCLSSTKILLGVYWSLKIQLGVIWWRLLQCPKDIW